MFVIQIIILGHGYYVIQYRYVKTRESKYVLNY